MNSFTSLLRAAAAATFLATAGIAAAETPDNHRIDEAWKAALVDQHGVLTEKQHGLINAIAYSAAAALLCEGLDIDPDKVATATTSVLADGPKDLSEEDELARYTEIMIMLGTAKGILLAEGAMHKADFCADAAEAKTEKPDDTFWK